MQVVQSTFMYVPIIDTLSSILINDKVLYLTFVSVIQIYFVKMALSKITLMERISKSAWHSDKMNIAFTYSNFMMNLSVLIR